MEKIRKNNKLTVIKAPTWMINPVEKIHVAVIGCGGTGSQVLQGLARMNHALENLGHEGFHVTAHDFDDVTESNRGRQLFAEDDIGKNKAMCLISKINRYYGYNWDAETIAFKKTNIVNYEPTIFMTCVDVVKPRHELLEYLKSSSLNHYWMDFGNGKDTGQVVLGSYGKAIYDLKKQNLLSGIDYYGIPEFDDDNTPSCSLAESLSKQDLMINTMVANTGLTMLWQAFSKLKFEYNASFINLKSMQIKSTLNYEK